jgi:hypothetical protein
MKTLNKFAFLVVALGLACSCFANDLKFLDNYYTKPGEIFLAPNGIYASIDGVLLQINTLCADSRGIYVPYEEIAGKLTYCPFCQSWYDEDYGHDCEGPRD